MTERGAKLNARSVLAVVIGILLVLAATEGFAFLMSDGRAALAQVAPARTSVGPSIEFLNPSKSTSLEVSNKFDVDNLYHLNAYVGEVPAEPFVEFELEEDDGTKTRIGDGIRRGNDTFDFFWNLDDFAFQQIPDGTYTLRARLFSSGSQVDVDEERIRINRRDPQPNTTEPEAAAETVEITYPLNAGGLGYFTNESGSTVFLVEGTVSSSTTFVRAFYTFTPPGDEPNFVACGPLTRAVDAQPSTSGVQVRRRCTLSSSQSGSSVTAVALLANDTDASQATPSELFNDSSDAHRTLPYAQDPTSVTITPASQIISATQCAFLTARVFDQFNRPVAGANVDAHAQGPTDQLRFDTSAVRSSANQPPERGGHVSETAFRCAAGDTGGLQGERNILGGPDVKHIESTSTGSGDEGDFVFGLVSDSPGGTQVTAWADEDFDDLHCSAEASGNATIGSGQSAPSPTGVAPDSSNCPNATPSPGGTATPTAGGTGTPTNTGTPTGTGTGTGTGTTGPTTADRTVTMTADKNRMPAGRRVTFSGQIVSNDQSCVDNEFVQIRRRVLGTTTFEDVFGTVTDSQGRFSVTRRARQSAAYVAVATAHDNCEEDASGEVTVLVKVLIQILPSDKTPERGERIRIKSSVRPQHDNSTLLLQRKKGRRWVTLDRDRMNNRSIGNFRFEANFGSRTFRTKWKSQDAEHEGNTSRAVTIRTR